jgi:AcrR family transcriptional regulator
MRRSAEDAKARILQAAQAEFALYGVTGARIDRIAREAGASKERLYAYFGDKQRLFDEVIRAAMEHVYNAVRIEGDDLIAYTGHLVEHFFRHPDDLRMLSWTRLEEQCERALTLDAVTAHHTEKADAVRRAQEAGLVDPVWDPDELLQLILVIATYWASASGSSAESPARYRGVAEEAVRRLVEPKR